MSTDHAQGRLSLAGNPMHLYAGLCGLAGSGNCIVQQQVLAIHLLIHHAAQGLQLGAGSQVQEAGGHECCPGQDEVVAPLPESMLLAPATQPAASPCTGFSSAGCLAGSSTQGPHTATCWGDLAALVVEAPPSLPGAAALHPPPTTDAGCACPPMFSQQHAASMAGQAAFRVKHPLELGCNSRHAIMQLPKACRHQDNTPQTATHVVCTRLMHGTRLQCNTLSSQAPEVPLM